jgi:hypothetical protein
MARATHSLFQFDCISRMGDQPREFPCSLWTYRPRLVHRRFLRAEAYRRPATGLHCGGMGRPAERARSTIGADEPAPAVLRPVA